MTWLNALATRRIFLEYTFTFSMANATAADAHHQEAQAVDLSLQCLSETTRRCDFHISCGQYTAMLQWPRVLVQKMLAARNITTA